MGLASGLVAIGLFLLGGAYSIFRADDPVRGRTTGQLVFTGVLVLASALAIAAGVLRF